MRQLIPAKVRKQVIERANQECEYCRLHQDDSFLAFEIDHAVPREHGGGDELANLALACPHCNQHKRLRHDTFLDNYQDVVPLFNPRFDTWSDHFRREAGEIIAKTRVGQATVKIFRFNEPDRLILRQLLAQAGRYPDLL
jgi:5-methylcytosine-specific restriction endonuclease McrA